MKAKLISALTLTIAAAFTIVLLTYTHSNQADPVNQNSTVHEWVAAGHAQRDAVPYPVRQQEPSLAPMSLPAQTEESSNWSGYAVTPAGSRLYTSVSGNWTVPKASGISSSSSAQWIGLGGISSSSLLQMGTIEQIQRNSETATLFWEQLPGSAKNIMNVPVRSQISASIFRSNNEIWSLQFKVTEPNGKRITKTVSVKLTASYEKGIETSAEWISEDPSSGSGGLYPLASTGVVNYTGATVNNQPISENGNSVQPLAMVSSANGLLIAPSSLLSNGTGFSTESTSMGNHYSSQGGYGTPEISETPGISEMPGIPGVSGMPHHFHVGRHYFRRWVRGY
ncbi:G1 family glutamic endopeptidase [Sporolactobacillus pectinivorans]|uniref:G1 family glutamic endopeptidase n=1 Tax=Sporolactobacillus pectinivorans TaxID=1591408 RepID=UPI000C25F9F8|nr:G1 family glutamic endopeptidase [Sporolactobacillus pectinivorans]